jgi:uncharacterized DUF497 family protein
MIEFEWNRSKDAVNQKKHSVSFEEAESVFFDEHALQFYDEDHSKSEHRFIMLGMSIKSRILIVCHCHRKLSPEKSSPGKSGPGKSGTGKSCETIRIISARKATKTEQQFYAR